MPKWERSKQDDRRQIQGVEDGRYIGHAIIPADADAICRAHNADIDALTAERDRLAAENTELKEDAIRDAGIECRLKADIAAANDTLDRLREAVPEGEGRSWSMLDAAYAILYPENET